MVDYVVVDYSATLSVTLYLHLPHHPSDCTACTRSRSPSAHHFLNTSVTRLVVFVHLPSQLVSHLGERFCITSPDSLQNSTSRSHPACGATAADNTQTSHLQFPGAESSFHLTLSSPVSISSVSYATFSIRTQRHAFDLPSFQVIQLVWFLLLFLSQHCKCSECSVGESWPNLSK